MQLYSCSTSKIPTFAFPDPGKGLISRHNQFLCQIGHIDIFLETRILTESETKRRVTASFRKNNRHLGSYIVPLTNLQRLPLPAVTKQVSNGLIVDLHVGHPQEELLLWALKTGKAISHDRGAHWYQ